MTDAERAEFWKERYRWLNRILDRKKAECNHLKNQLSILLGQPAPKD
jgi:hypothetical protein